MVSNLQAETGFWGFFWFLCQVTGQQISCPHPRPIAVSLFFVPLHKEKGLLWGSSCVTECNRSMGNCNISIQTFLYYWYTWIDNIQLFFQRWHVPQSYQYSPLMQHWKHTWLNLFIGVRTLKTAFCITYLLWKKKKKKKSCKQAYFLSSFFSE